MFRAIQADCSNKINPNYNRFSKETHQCEPLTSIHPNRINKKRKRLCCIKNCQKIQFLENLIEEYGLEVFSK